MHGAFWKFPPDFDSKHARGIRMRSNYLKVVGDFCEWNGKIVLGCDDSAKKEFFNKRPMKAENCPPEKSNSNLVFLDPEQLDKFGAPIGRGSVFLREDAPRGTLSEPMLVGGFSKRVLTLSCANKKPVRVAVVSISADGSKSSKTVEISESAPKFETLGTDAEWAQIEALDDVYSLTAHFDLAEPEQRATRPSTEFDGIARIENGADSVALMRSTADKTLAIVALRKNKSGGFDEIGTYALDTNLNLKAAKLDAKTANAVRSTMIKPEGVSFDGGSVLVVEDGKRYRLPLDRRFLNMPPNARVAREVATERDLFNCGGTFYELPARNAQGMAKIRPIASHPFAVFDYASFCGLMFISGMSDTAAAANNPHVIVSDDGKFSLWAGSIDDLWKLGKPVGEGCAWQNQAVENGSVSDPFLLTGYDKKTLKISSQRDVKVAVEIDVDGTGLWLEYCAVDVKGGEAFEKLMPENFSGYWVRFRALGESPSITASLLYE